MNNQDRRQRGELWLTQQFISLQRQTVGFFEERCTVDQTEAIVRNWAKLNRIRILFKKEPRRADKNFYVTVTKIKNGQY